ncbi:hypothetical protein GCM10009693_07050 [Leucobacter chromiireducens subsp. chromiireducens]
MAEAQHDARAIASNERCGPYLHPGQPRGLEHARKSETSGEEHKGAREQARP